MHVLVGDIGGTTTRLALVDCEGNQCTISHRSEYTSADTDKLTTLVKAFLEEYSAPVPERACFAVAGPIIKQGDSQAAHLTNLPWELNSKELASQLNIHCVKLINDFQAVGYGLAALDPTDLITLQAGKPDHKYPRVVLGAGTGLGQAVLFRKDDHYEVLPTEGGHVDFAPQDQDQIALLMELIDEFGHVSYERLLSGPGLIRIYRFFQQRHNKTLTMGLEDVAGDPAPWISTQALSGENPVARQALDLFVRIYGAQASNLALSVMAKGGVFIAGGIGRKILPAMQDGTFIKSFNNKGRMTTVTRNIPVQIINNPDVGLLGAALVASQHPLTDF